MIIEANQSGLTTIKDLTLAQLYQIRMAMRHTEKIAMSAPAIERQNHNLILSELDLYFDYAAQKVRNLELKD